MSDGSQSLDGTHRREHWKPRPGNYYIYPGTWIRDRLGILHDKGVVSEIGDQHTSGTVKIGWYPKGTEWVSAPTFRQRLREGRYVIDDEQHPFDKVDWAVAPSLNTGTEQQEGGR